MQISVLNLCAWWAIWRYHNIVDVGVLFAVAVTFLLVRQIDAFIAGKVHMFRWVGKLTLNHMIFMCLTTL